MYQVVWTSSSIIIKVDGVIKKTVASGPRPSNAGHIVIIIIKRLERENNSIFLNLISFYLIFVIYESWVVHIQGKLVWQS